MKPSAIAILEERGCEIPKEAPPSEAVNTKNPVNTDGPMKNFNSIHIVQACNEQSNPQSKEDKYIHLRQYYVNQVKGETRKQILDKKADEIRKILLKGSPEQIEQLYLNRHKWRQAIHEFRNDDKPICKVENCINVVVPGCEYCINHINLDPNQKLFVICEKCHRPHPVCSECFTCK
ncbi:hypothetical protein TVAG_319910 [Trichomonas vaginalis G3]|uniref:KAT8 regulatory NSL complex subunit 2 n=1 Tax=Trichomonas vaginalis (strain ATCC PRA-98 / G3) TaxID=412133 RepID=A2DQD9_TRIV3|nr:hypothetical protein TVAGG3_1009740 [Trichomonas vaginalis G3]EAY17396.1 hypothetical protein TVAG_319910 [Trichomonas vaginalis G3]KAI5491406.1 hypothetical protein TVAGG3_1009740 [Trichomonas vaginalis G3]|eukprot:XP_001330765.1 hypothetical protein [Trichomonas vaginalis G3]